MKSRAWIRVVGLTVAVTILVQLSLLIVPVLKSHFAVGKPHLYTVILVTCLAVPEIIAVVGLGFFMRFRGQSFGQLGLFKRATPWGWIAGLALGMLTAGFGFANASAQLKSPLSVLLDPGAWHIYSALVAGLSAGFCEEILFRGYVMTELANAGIGRTIQVIASGILFGCIHIGVFKSGLIAGLNVILPTAVLGMLYSLVYLLSKRSLMPSIVSHFINDAVVIPLAITIAGVHG